MTLNSGVILLKEDEMNKFNNENAPFLLIGGNREISSFGMYFERSTKYIIYELKNGIRLCRLKRELH